MGRKVRTREEVRRDRCGWWWTCLLSGRLLPVVAVGVKIDRSDGAVVNRMYGVPSLDLCDRRRDRRTRTGRGLGKVSDRV